MREPSIGDVARVPSVEPPAGREREIHAAIKDKTGRDNVSAPSYEIADGKRVASFGEARLVALEKLTHAERERAVAAIEHDEAQREVKAALARRGATQKRLDETTVALRTAQRNLGNKVGILVGDITLGPDDRTALV